MNWEKFTVEACPKDADLIFLDSEGNWFEGKLHNDWEHGWMIDLWETSSGVDGITHFLIIELP